MLTQTEFSKKLAALGACQDGYDFAKDMSLHEFWQKCKRPDWMVWVIRKMPDCFPIVEKTTWVAVAIKSAESVLYLAESSPNAHSAAIKAIEAAKAWLNNPTAENRQASDAAASYAADAAARAADAAASYAADAAARAAAYSVYAARAAAYAVYAAALAADADAAARAAAYSAYAADATYAADAAYSAAYAASDFENVADYIRQTIKVKTI